MRNLHGGDKIYALLSVQYNINDQVTCFIWLSICRMLLTSKDYLIILWDDICERTLKIAMLHSVVMIVIFIEKRVLYLCIKYSINSLSKMLLLPHLYSLTLNDSSVHRPKS